MKLLAISTLLVILSFSLEVEASVSNVTEKSDWSLWASIIFNGVAGLGFFALFIYYYMQSRKGDEESTTWMAMQHAGYAVMIALYFGVMDAYLIAELGETTRSDGVTSHYVRWIGVTLALSSLAMVLSQYFQTMSTAEGETVGGQGRISWGILFSTTAGGVFIIFASLTPMDGRTWISLAFAFTAFTAAIILQMWGYAWSQKLVESWRAWLLLGFYVVIAALYLVFFILSPEVKNWTALWKVRWVYVAAEFMIHLSVFFVILTEKQDKLFSSVINVGRKYSESWMRNSTAKTKRAM